MTSFNRILGQSWKVKFHKVKLLKFKTLNFDLKFCWNWSFFHYEKIMRFKKSPQLPGAGRTSAGHHHGSHMPTSPGAILLSKMACQPKHIGRQCSWLFSMYFYPVSDLSLWAAVITLLVGSVMSFPLAFGIIAQDPRYTSLPFVSVHKVQVQGNSPGLT